MHLISRNSVKVQNVSGLQQNLAKQGLCLPWLSPDDILLLMSQFFMQCSHCNRSQGQLFANAKNPSGQSGGLKNWFRILLTNPYKNQEGGELHSNLNHDQPCPELNAHQGVFLVKCLQVPFAHR